MTAKIDAYIDCVSPYSYFATLYLRQNRKALESHGVEVEFHPIFLGGVNVGSGNKPPWTLPAKAAYGKFDNARACNYFGVPQNKTPDFFPILSIMPQRCLIYIKNNYSREQFEKTFLSLSEWMYHKNIDVSKPEKLAELLRSHGFLDEDIKKILAAAASPEYKEALTANTQKALDLGAYGAPWFWVRNSKGKEEPFFGSDRFAYMWQYLDLPFQDIAIIENGKAKL
ncbi:HCCA isomerase/glutathione S-transferase kappa [Penicillium verhagenii]|uniref:HCCA isomerase/glutathione S-transferase kappa n=1 Tax=Penicillium verhagenii TaxID=1562060 RepID=UPI0025452CF9|nr:HCCA isomerase/glutathione S-transferase kappa [Penicillium verhagenii]KAJ5923976.1 HCCA isomerase/glutathione S-transferase kappa [Penicillium verhagenii]